MRIQLFTAANGKTYQVTHYNLDMVLALGFRGRSPMALRFRPQASHFISLLPLLQPSAVPRFLSPPFHRKR